MVDKGYIRRFVHAYSSQCWSSISVDKGRSPPQGTGTGGEKADRIYATFKMGNLCLTFKQTGREQRNLPVSFPQLPPAQNSPMPKQHILG